MTSPLNEQCFVEPHWRVIARGFQTEDWFNEGQAVGSGGIVNPVPVRLPTGQYYYRFASSNSSPESQFGGGWWLDFENFNSIQALAQRNQSSLRDSARLMLALPYDWTRVDRLIRALLKEPLRAYAGQGKPASGSEGERSPGNRWTPTQHIKLRQLFIPGLLRESESKEPLFRRAFLQPATIRSLSASSGSITF